MAEKMRCVHCMREVSYEHAVFCEHCGESVRYENPSRCLRTRTILNNKYMIGKVIGEGGFGITYIAFDLLLNSRIAIKEYFPSNLATRDTSTGIHTALSIITGNNETQYRKGIERFVKEAESLARFNHLPGIVSVREFFYENNTAYMVMEYIDGITLKQYMDQKGGRINYNDALTLMVPVMDSLQTVHEAGIIHRDISPDNIMVITADEDSDRSGLNSVKALKLIDFGAARFFDNEDAKSLTVILKHGYAPEEQYQTTGNQGPWTDVYAVSATIYKMITGKTPQSAPDRLMSKDTVSPLNEVDSAIPKFFSDAIMRGMAIKHPDRTQSINGLLAEIDGRVRDSINKQTKAKIGRNIIVMAAILMIAIIAIRSFMISKKDNSSKANMSANTASTDVNNAGAATGDEASVNDLDNNDAKVADKTQIIKEIYTEDELLTRIEFFSGQPLENVVYDDFDGDGKKELFGMCIKETKQPGSLFSDETVYKAGCIWFGDDKYIKKVYEMDKIMSEDWMSASVECVESLDHRLKVYQVNHPTYDTSSYPMDVNMQYYDFTVVKGQPEYINDPEVFQTWYNAQLENDAQGVMHPEFSENQLLEYIEEKSKNKMDVWLYEDYDGDGVKEMFAFYSEESQYYWPIVWFSDGEQTSLIFDREMDSFSTAKEMEEKSALVQFGKTRQWVLNDFGTGSSIFSYSFGYENGKPFYLSAGTGLAATKEGAYAKTEVWNTPAELAHYMVPQDYFCIYWMQGAYFELASSNIPESLIEGFSNYDEIRAKWETDIRENRIYWDLLSDDLIEAGYESEWGQKIVSVISDVGIDGVIEEELVYCADGYIYKNFNYNRSVNWEMGVSDLPYCYARLRIIGDGKLEYLGLFNGYRPERATSYPPYYPNLIQLMPG